MILFRILRWIIYLTVIILILLATIKLYEKHKVQNALKDYKTKVVTLTFDDGPVPATKDIIDMLDSVGVKATFFALGDETSRRPEILRYAYDHGHAIGNHSWSHPHVLGFRNRDYIERQIDKAEDAIKSATNAEVTFFRTPFGESSPYLNWILAGKGMIGVHWTLALRDWRKDSSKEQIADLFAHIEKSEVVLLHDRVYADPEKLETLKQSILDLKARGFRFITVPELYQ
ncbi:MAG: hypothetical protein RJB39_615 [Candidatus Parcubacteria bacterium]|jgi:peptidoglycan/xylan/chitin deacetylase (PgdA/CDA1 family)